MIKMFFIDDSLFQVTVTAQLPGELGYDVTSSRDPMEASDLICQREFDCFITDHLMPGMNGVQLLEKLKVKMPELTVILLTSNIQKSVEEDALAKGASGFLAKPANKDSLDTALKQVAGL